MNKSLPELEKQKQELIEKLQNPNIGTDTDKVSEISRDLGRLEKEIAKVRSAQGSHAGHVVIEIYAGAGGIDAQDWARMLLEMYQKWAEKQGWRAELIEASYNEHSGIKSAALKIEGSEAYQKLKNESGVHRLVRRSPFSAKQIRHTSFAMVEILPELKEIHSLDIPEKDLRIDTYRASGPGGQYVNKRESAVRITHLPTGLAAASQNARTQAANRETAMKLLKIKLLRLKQEQRSDTLEALKPKGQPAWGNQIRSYIFHPYQLIKDHRSGRQTSQLEAVLNGELNLLLP
jgi:peptide chain release factor 2